MLRNLFKKRMQSGFTIIEVMIVLAIAGLIMVVVLVAVPQLQRNQRNEARRSILARISTEISNYSGNNNGRIPISQGDIDGLTDRYLDSINIEDPSSGVDFAVVLSGTAPGAGGSIASGDLVEGQATYRSGYKCNGESITSSTTRSYAIWTLFEGGAIYCLDNI